MCRGRGCVCTKRAQSLTFLLPRVPLERPTHHAVTAGWPSLRHFVQWKSPLVLIVFKIPSWLRYLIREPCLEPGCWEKIRAGGWTIPTSQSKPPYPDLHKSLSRLEELSSELPGTALPLPGLIVPIPAHAKAQFIISLPQTHISASLQIPTSILHTPFTQPHLSWIISTSCPPPRRSPCLTSFLSCRPHDVPNTSPCLVPTAPASLSPLSL